MQTKNVRPHSSILSLLHIDTFLMPKNAGHPNSDQVVDGWRIASPPNGRFLQY
ncbi:hypothetical protein [Dyadobacter pollutisoli]|uniref:Uncharacterized protein n=1 Tax=Dyadobacter pollutisoli TaxID=2910158 RepID=A0A9E8NAJ4_9BACT|nr:hypothetical protein [Dyadobacter pollutisoli]WAC13054.1 hypothetical protein ON006_03630 [Dyadobacter pollutisoli]